MRKRYWARNYAAWPKFSSTTPNKSHHIIAEWQSSQHLKSLITQNVDRLHQKAGSKNVIDLHGASAVVRCLHCDFRTSRHSFQYFLSRLNPGWFAQTLESTPDGDVNINQEAIDKFNV